MIASHSGRMHWKQTRKKPLFQHPTLKVKRVKTKKTVLLKKKKMCSFLEMKALSCLKLNLFKKT